MQSAPVETSNYSAHPNAPRSAQDIPRSVKREHGLASVAALHGGVVTVLPRFRSDLGLYGRGFGLGPPPAQLPTSGTYRTGLRPRVLASNRTLGQGCRMRRREIQRSTKVFIRSQVNRVRWLGCRSARNHGRMTSCESAQAARSSSQRRSRRSTPGGHDEATLPARRGADVAASGPSDRAPSALTSSVPRLSRIIPAATSRKGASGFHVGEAAPENPRQSL